MKYCFGIDVGGTTIKEGLFTEEGKLVREWSVPTRPGENGAWIYSDAAEAVRRAMAEEGLTASEILGAGIAMPGTVTEDGKFGHGNNIATRGGYPAEEISSRLDGMKAMAANDANAAALGEAWTGAGRKYRSMCMVTLGTGVGGCVIEDGKIVTGVHGAAGEIGHMCVEPKEKKRCNCGSRGCTEQYASATGIVRVAGRLLQSGDPLTEEDPEKPYRYESHPLRRQGTFTAKDVCDLAKAGDELSLKALDVSMDYLGRALSYVALTTDPEAFVIGGGVAAAGEVILERIRKKLFEYSPLIGEEKQAKVVPAELGNRAGIYGAAALLISKNR